MGKVARRRESWGSPPQKQKKSPPTPTPAPGPPLCTPQKTTPHSPQVCNAQLSRQPSSRARKKRGAMVAGRSGRAQDGGVARRDEGGAPSSGCSRNAVGGIRTGDRGGRGHAHTNKATPAEAEPCCDWLEPAAKPAHSGNASWKDTPTAAAAFGHAHCSLIGCGQPRPCREPRLWPRPLPPSPVLIG